MSNDVGAKDSDKGKVAEGKLVKMRITDQGNYYEHNGRVEGPFTLEDERANDFDSALAQKLGVDVKDILKAQLTEIDRPTSFDEVADVLSSTVKRDRSTKLVILCVGILVNTDGDQINISMSGESSAGKTYICLEVMAYFPESMLIIVGRASPTAFIHDVGEYDKTTNVYRINLSGKIIVFADQPHYTLLEMLRPVVSHDRRELLYKTTDKASRGQLRTKNVIIRGYPSVIYCAAGMRLNEQEQTRMLILSPDIGEEKIMEGLELAFERVCDRTKFKRQIELNPRRRWLKAHIESLFNSGVKDVVIDNPEILDRFLRTRPRLAPRHQRDLPRLLAFIKAHALLNFRHRQKRGEEGILATKEDVDAGFKLYESIAGPTELGIAPQAYEIYKSIIRPLAVEKGVISRQEVSVAYYRHYGRPLPDHILRKDILPSLEGAGLITQEADPHDRRTRLIRIPDTSDISCEKTILEPSGGQTLLEGSQTSQGSQDQKEGDHSDENQAPQRDTGKSSEAKLQ